LTYLYDFGDDGSHTIRLEKIVAMMDDELGIILLEAIGRCPPEDCRGRPGYHRLFEIIEDPADDEHRELLSRCGGSFDLTRADLPTLEQMSNVLPGAGLCAGPLFPD
jgi:hypothetical protein